MNQQTWCKKSCNVSKNDVYVCVRVFAFNVTLTVAKVSHKALGL